MNVTTTDQPMVYGQFTQISNDFGIVVCDADTLPPIALLEPVQPEGWALLDGVLDFDAGKDGWLEVYVYLREGSHSWLSE